MRPLLNFFKREKVYGVLLVIIIAFYAFYLTHKAVIKPQSETSPIMEQFKKAEERFQEKVKDKKALEDYMKGHPKLSFAINAFGVLIILIFMAGIILDIMFWFRPGFRQKLDGATGPPAFAWSFSLLFRFFIWFFSLNIAAGFVLMGIRRFAGGDENFYVLLHTTLAEWFSFIVILVLVQRRGGSKASLGLWNPGSFFQEMKMGWLSYAGVLPLFAAVLVILLAITKLMHYEPPPHPLVPILLEEENQSPFIVYYSLFLACIMGPFFEEVFFRGFCYPALKSRIGKLGAMIATSVFFALIHDSTFAFWPIFVLGLCLNYIYEKRGSLIACLTLHITHNTIFLTYFYLAKKVIGLGMGQ